MPVPINTKRLARDVRMMLDSANAHLLATGVKNLNAYLYAAMSRGALESALSALEAAPDGMEEAVKQLNQLDAEAVALCEKFERMFDIQLKQAPAPSVPVLTVQPNGKMTQQEPVEHRKRGPYEKRHSVTLNGRGKFVPQNGNRGRRLSTAERLEIWRWGQEHPTNTRQERLELCQIYDVTEMTVDRWLENHPGEHE